MIIYIYHQNKFNSCHKWSIENLSVTTIWISWITNYAYVDGSAQYSDICDLEAWEQYSDICIFPTFQEKQKTDYWSVECIYAFIYCIENFLLLVEGRIIFGFECLFNRFFCEDSAFSSILRYLHIYFQCYMWISDIMGLNAICGYLHFKSQRYMWISAYLLFEEDNGRFGVIWHLGSIECKDSAPPCLCKCLLFCVQLWTIAMWNVINMINYIL